MNRFLKNKFLYIESIESHRIARVTFDSIVNFKTSFYLSQLNPATATTTTRQVGHTITQHKTATCKAGSFGSFASFGCEEKRRQSCVSQKSTLLPTRRDAFESKSGSYEGDFMF